MMTSGCGQNERVQQPGAPQLSAAEARGDAISFDLADLPVYSAGQLKTVCQSLIDDEKKEWR